MVGGIKNSKQLKDNSKNDDGNKQTESRLI
jgi:hypothetical protein